MVSAKNPKKDFSRKNKNKTKLTKVKTTTTTEKQTIF